ncbi:ABC transporter substrate-binding protein [Blastococcus colisei]|uniref:ABC transporter substrate-binding protein n=1 Tax=Blastococcus colisei TaxID=1564162 RepID=UPI00147701A1|nr:ABC transporter substrate-binding protein [Blastococcus colisei]
MTSAMLVAGCGGSAVSGGGGDEAAADGPIRIGVVGPMSGGSALFGAEFPIGAELAVQWLEENGGTDREIELTTVDDQSDPEVAVAGVRELTDQGVHIFIGTVNSPVALALGPVMQQTDSVLLTTAAHAMEVNHENFNEHVFRVTDNPYMRQRAQAQLATEVAPDVDSWSLVGPDHAYGVSTMRSFMSGLNDFAPDATINDPILAPFGASDYRNAMSSVMSQQPEGVFSALYANDAVTAYQQAQAMGLWENTLLMDSANEFFVARAMKAQTPDHWTAFHWYHGAYDNEMSTFIAENYMEEHGVEPTGFVGEAFSAVLAVAAAAEAGGSTATDDLIENLEGLEWETPSGERLMRAEDHQTVKDVNFVRLRGCETCPEGFEVVETRTIDGTDIIEPATPGEAVDYGPETEI